MGPRQLAVLSPSESRTNKTGTVRQKQSLLASLTIGLQGAGYVHPYQLTDTQGHTDGCPEEASHIADFFTLF